MNCPTCNTNKIMVSSTWCEAGAVRRIRNCKNSHTWFTVETIDLVKRERMSRPSGNQRANAKPVIKPPKKAKPEKPITTSKDYTMTDAAKALLEKMESRTIRI